MILGVLGGGQLGRMLALAGYPLGMRFRFFDPADEVCVDDIAPRVRAAYEDVDALAQFADGVDVVTYEFENVPVDAVRALEARGARLLPPLVALDVSQDRLTEKQFLNGLGIATAPFAAVDSAEGLRSAVATLGLPAILKTRRMGYDCKGEAVLRSDADAEAAIAAFDGTPSILEGVVPFARELSVIAVRGLDGAVVCYPLVQNWHHDGILRVSRTPSPVVNALMQADAEYAARRVLEALDYVGVLTIEWFEHEGRLVANEIAPRVHNSGHWTIEGAATSQFENHLRAVTGLPLGLPQALGVWAMVNLVGTPPPLETLASLSGAHVHMYGKAPRTSRKVGHVTLCAVDEGYLDARLAELLHVVGIETGNTARA